MVASSSPEEVRRWLGLTDGRTDGRTAVNADELINIKHHQQQQQQQRRRRRRRRRIQVMGAGGDRTMHISFDKLHLSRQRDRQLGCAGLGGWSRHQSLGQTDPPCSLNIHDVLGTTKRCGHVTCRAIRRFLIENTRSSWHEQLSRLSVSAGSNVLYSAAESRVTLIMHCCCCAVTKLLSTSMHAQRSYRVRDLL